MSEVKEKMVEIVLSQPDDSTYEEIMRELAFEKLIAKGLDDAKAGRVISHEEAEERAKRFYSNSSLGTL